MFKLSHLLSHASSVTQATVLALMLVLCWNIENIAGLSFNYSKRQHSFLNAKFIVSNFPVQLLLGFAFSKILLATSQHRFGLIYHLGFSKNNLLVFIVSFTFLDLGEYIYHVLMHKIKRLWMFHLVHHCDAVVDVSTSLREHPGENFIRSCLTLLWILLSGIPFWALLLRQIIQIVSNVFSHLNYRLPEKLDNVIGWIFITPNLHHLHHHYLQPYTDSNYGDVLSIWDRIFGTFHKLASLQVVYGVDTCMDEKEHSKYLSLLKLPFGKYRKSKRPG